MDGLNYSRNINTESFRALYLFGGLYMELSGLQQYGLAAVFIVAAWRFYTDMRNDSTKREDKLMEHLGKVSDTLEKIDARLYSLERKDIQ
jgi:membrane protein implicated in regulation of membrane protease activity